MRSSKNTKRVSKDSVINVHGVAHDGPSFGHLIQTWSDLLIVFGLQEVIDLCNDILKCKDRNTYFTYDTTFNLGDFYLSTALVRNVIFTSQPTLPCLFCCITKR